MLFELATEAGEAVFESLDREFAAVRAGPDQPAPGEGEGFIGEDVGTRVVAEAVLSQLGQFDVGEDTAAPGLIDEGLPVSGGRFPFAGAGVAAGSALERLEAFGTARDGRESRLVVAGGGRMLTGVFGGAGRLERVTRAVIADRGEMGGEGDEREDVPGVVAEHGTDVGRVAAALEAEVPLGDLCGWTVILTFESEQLAFDHRQAVGFDDAFEEPPVGMEQVQVGERAEGGPLAREYVAGFERGDIERLAVVAHQGARAGELTRDAAEEAVFVWGPGRRNCRR